MEHYTADSRYIPGRSRRHPRLLDSNPSPAAYDAGGIPLLLFAASWPTPHPHDVMISSHYADSTHVGARFRHHSHGYYVGHDQYGRRNIPPPLPLPALGRSDLFDFVDDSAILRQDRRYRDEQPPAPFHQNMNHHYGLYNPAPKPRPVHDHDHRVNEEGVLILEGSSYHINENNHREEDIDDRLLQLGIIRSTADDSNNNPMNNQDRDGIEDAVTRFLDARRVCDGAGDSEMCVICQEDLAPSSEEEDQTAAAVVLDCAHRFHSNCIKQWLITGKTFCPLCRVPISIPTNS